jgi:sugar/nucleoside kinase (ribokinase family)
VDTTGCGDVFAAAAARALAGGAGIFEAVEAGVALASRAVASAGLRETFELAVRDGRA